MEDNKNHNYDQEDRDYKDAPATTDFEKSKLNNDPNQVYQKNLEQYDGDHPNRYTNSGTNTNSGNLEEKKWEEDANLDSNVDDSSNSPHPIYNSDDDFESDESENNGDLESDLDDKNDFGDEDDESDFNESDIDDDDEDYDNEINNENSDLDDDWANRKN